MNQIVAPPPLPRSRCPPSAERSRSRKRSRDLRLDLGLDLGVCGLRVPFRPEGRGGLGLDARQ